MRLFSRSLACVSLLALIGAGAPKPKRLIEFGWDEPDTAYLRAHAGEMAKSPFDGTVFHANVVGSGGKVENLAWISWGRRAVKDEEVRAAFDDLAAFNPASFRHNLLRFNTTPADLDWFDDHSAILSNARLAARLAKAGRCRGILLDTEPYEKPLFRYRKQRDAATKSFDAYAAQARLRGREIMAAFQAEYPGLVVLLTFGPSLSLRESKGGTIPAADLENGLLSPFVRGMIEAARDGSRIVDGYEMSYGYKSPDQFASALDTIHAEPDIGAGFGLWIDYDWRRKGWDASDPAKNYFTPPSLEASLRSALERADEFVWIYAETPRWWTPDGKPVKLPSAYDAAIRRARTAD